MLEAYIYDGARTPFGRQDGALSRVRPDDMLGDVIKAVVARSGFKPDTIDYFLSSFSYCSPGFGTTRCRRGSKRL